MKFITAFLALAGVAAAQTVQSKPFNLVLSSADKTLNGQILNACHTGAAIESLCVGYNGTDFHFNTTKGSQAALKGFTPAGVLVWTLPSCELSSPFRPQLLIALTSYLFFPLAAPIPESESMNFYVDPSTNVALPLFEPSYNAQYVTFDSSNLMKIVVYLNDTKTPPADGDGRALDNWYVCETNFEGYTYETLAWALGTAKPQNPSCVKVSVERKFV